MKPANVIRQHWAALRALLVLTVITGIAYPLVVWAIAQVPGLHDKANGSIVTVAGKPMGSSLIGQLFTDADGNALPRYFQSRASNAARGRWLRVRPDGHQRRQPGAGEHRRRARQAEPADPGLPAQRGSRQTRRTGRRPAVLHRRRRRRGAVGDRPAGEHRPPSRTSGAPDPRGRVNQPCPATPFLATYEGVRVECAQPDENYAIGQIVAIRGAAPADPAVPADAVTASGSGLDPDISPAYAYQQVDRVAKARGIAPEQVRRIVDDNSAGRTLGFLGEPRVNVLAVNIALDELASGG